MDVICSFDNSLVKRIAKLQDKKYREEFKEFIAEGFRDIADSFGYAFIKGYFKNIAISEEKAEQYWPVFKDFAGTVIVKDTVFQKIAVTQNSQGIMAVLKQKEDTEVINDYVLYLDRIRDPGNLGTMIRTAAAAGYSVVLDNCVDVYNPKVVRSCMSAVLKANIVKGGVAFIDKLKKLGYNLVCADMSGENLFGQSVGIGKPIVAIGSEAEGLSGEVLKRADKVFALPMEGMESLNASVCASVLMYNLKYGQKN